MLNFGYGSNGPSSHAEMWNGEQWVSDTRQGQRAFVYRDKITYDITEPLDFLIPG